MSRTESVMNRLKDEKHHLVRIKVPAVKFWGMTIRPEYEITKRVSCPHGEIYGQPKWAELFYPKAKDDKAGE